MFIARKQLEIVSAGRFGQFKLFYLLAWDWRKNVGLWRFGLPQGFVQIMGALMRDNVFLLETVVKPFHCTTTTTTPDFSMVASQVPFFL